MSVPPLASGWSWARGLRPSSALLVEVVRLTVAAVLVINLVFAVFLIGAPTTYGLTFTPHDPKYAGVAQYDSELFALDRPFVARYAVFFSNLIGGNLGISFYYRSDVTTLVWNALPLTFELMIASLLWALLIGGLLGWIASSGRSRSIRAIAGSSGSVLYALPVFGVLLLILEWAAFGLGIGMGVPDLTLPRVTGFFTLDSLLSGNLDLFWQALWTTALLSLPAGLAFALPVLHRVRKAIEFRRSSSEFANLPLKRPLPFTDALRASTVPNAGALGVLIPFVFGASLVAELVSGRRGVGLGLALAFANLDAPLALGMVLIPCLVVLAVSAPFTLLAAFLAREERASDPTPRALSPSHGATISGSVRRLFHRPSLPFWIGVALFAIPVGLSLAAPVVAPLGPLARVAPMGACTTGLDCPLSPPSAEHPLGVDFYGLDIFAEVTWGGLSLLQAIAVAAAMAGGLGLVLGLLVPPLGRAADLPSRVVLGGIAALPVVLVLWLLAAALPLALAVGLMFIPLIFRDVRDAGEIAAGPEGAPPAFAGLRGWSDRAVAWGRTAIPGFVVRLPRRVAEMALLVEGFGFLFRVFLGPVDWAWVVAQGVSANAILIGNPWWLWTPGLLLFLLAAGLMLISDGLRHVISPERPTMPAPSPPPTPEPSPPLAGGNP